MQQLLRCVNTASVPNDHIYLISQNLPAGFNRSKYLHKFQKI
jgi:hypothetical protein